MSAVDLASVVLTAGGLFFYVAGTVGLLRFPDVFSRLHALTKADNLGLGLLVAGVALQARSVFEVLQLVLIWLLAMAAGAASCYLVARYARRSKAVTAAAEENHG